MFMSRKNRRIAHVKGLKPLELLLGASLLSVIASLLIITMNPAANFSEAKNASRFSAANVIAESLYRYAIDHHGEFPDSLNRSSEQEICKEGISRAVCAAHSLADLSFLVPRYVKHIPEDPLSLSGPGTGYILSFDQGKTIVVSALHVEGGDSIIVRR